MAISGTGSAGQEACVVNLVEPGERVLVCINGVFGGRLADMAERAGGAVTRIERPWGEVFTVAEVKEALARVKPKIVAIVLAETSTGAWQPIEEIAAAVTRGLVRAIEPHMRGAGQVDDDDLPAGVLVAAQDGVRVVVAGVAQSLEVAFQARKQLAHFALACCRHRLQR